MRDNKEAARQDLRGVIPVVLAAELMPAMLLLTLAVIPLLLRSWRSSSPSAH